MDKVAEKLSIPPHAGADYTQIELTGDEIAALLEQARQTRERSYSPYSRFKVGAAILGQSGKIYTGCNVENASFSATICAERAALCGAISAGENQLRAVAIIADTKTPCPPCGVCRQMLSEFGLGMWVVMGALDGSHRVVTLGSLLPEAFDSNAL